MGRIWQAIRAVVKERIKEEYEREIKPFRHPLRTLGDKVGQEIRGIGTGTFGEHLLGQAPMYNPAILYRGSRRDYVDERDRKIADYDFDYSFPLPNDPNYRITRFSINVYVPKGQEKKLDRLVAAELRRLTDRQEILDFEGLVYNGLVEGLAYEVTGGQAREAGRGIFRVFGDDMKKTFSMRPKQREPKAAGATYDVIITPMIPRTGPGYAGGHAGPTGAPTPLLPDPTTGVYRPAPGK